MPTTIGCLADNRIEPTALRAAYCGRPGADEEDHVVARQFFPAEERYRGHLPKVPSHGTCNREKQRIEDGPAVLFQFGDGSEASRHVQTRRVPATLSKNRRLHTSLRHGLQEVLVRHPSGLVLPALGINLSTRELADSHAWFQLITRGLYYFEFREPLDADHTVHLLRPTSSFQGNLGRKATLARDAVQVVVDDEEAFGSAGERVGKWQALSTDRRGC